jgi:hypothetical protein
MHSKAKQLLGSPAGNDIAARLRAAFYCDNDVWRGMVLGQSFAACKQAMAGLRAS